MDLSDFLGSVIDVISSPWGKLISAFLSIASFGFSIWALKTTLF